MTNLIGLYKENIIQANIFYLVLGYARYYFVLLHKQRTISWL